MRRLILKVKYFCRRNYAAAALLVLLALAYYAMNGALHHKLRDDLEKSKQTELQVVYQDSLALALKRQLSNREQYLLDNIRSMNGANFRAQTAGRITRAYNESVLKNDSVYTAASASYSNYIVAERGKIEKKYEARLREFDHAGGFTDKSAFVLGIALIGIGATSLLIKMHRMRSENQILLLAVFELFAGVVTLSVWATDGFMLYHRLVLMFEIHAYAVFGAFAFSAGPLVFTVLQHYTDRAALLAEMLNELHAPETEKPKQENNDESARSEEERKPLGITWRKKRHWLEEIDLSPYQCLADLPMDKIKCCEIYAAFTMQSYRPTWLSLSLLEEYLKSGGQVGVSRASLSLLINSLQTKKAA